MATIKKKKKPAIKRHKDSVTISVTLPEETFYHIKQCAKDEIRNVNQQARLFIEVGIQVMQQQPAEDQEESELESAIGFQVDKSEIEEEYEDE